MEHQEFAAPEALQDTIKCFWYNRGDFGAEQSSFEVVPDSSAEIIFYFGSTCSVASDEGLQPLSSPFMVGLLNQPALFYTQGMFEIIGIRCFPWTVFDLLGLPPGKDGVRQFTHPVARLQSDLAPLIAAGAIEAAVAIVKAYFLDAHAQIARDSMLFKAGTAMQEANGALPVNRIAAAAHATVRTLERKFKRSSGYTVKDVSALLRFEQVRNRLWQHPEVGIAGLAQELGYADQSHLSREFKRYSGTTPAAFARKAKHARQAIAKDFVAFVQD
ncbi:helix-turn-helix domain-containing protein [Taibaiella koreensis]|uniref:helix-turn-helix domain-containing protein n=1 Tax=Taibaiella koreensis TaxID=1268548 RepID=UPI000E59A076|nr:helix-turn-helix domain-containing protein [Taibaiella koreensis]